MKSYRLAIADAPKRIAATDRRDIQKHCYINVLSHCTDTRPRPRSASGTLPYLALPHFDCLSAPVRVPDPSLVRRGRETGASDAR